MDCLSSFTPKIFQYLPIPLPELEERMKTLAINKPEEAEKGDTFAERAESYYKNRPQLLALLQDLYNGYVTLSDRYVQALTKCNLHRKQQSSPIPSIDEYFSDQEVIESDAESSLSYQQPPKDNDNDPVSLNIDSLIAELVMKNVEYDILTEEVTFAERQCSESSRKIELQKSLLEVLESERLILLNENARLGFRVTTLVEENKGLASESVFMQRRAGELTRCMLKLREDHRVFMLSRKIEDLEGQIYGLEKRNREYYELLTRKDREGKNAKTDTKMKVLLKKKMGVGMKCCFMGNERVEKDENVEGKSGKKVTNWWGKVKSMDLFLCGVSST